MNPRWPSLAIGFFIAVSTPFCLQAQFKNPQEDLAGREISKQFPDAFYGALNSVEEYTFDKGNKVLGNPVVSATCNETVDFTALKDFINFRYYQRYNRFVDLKKFTLLHKTGSKFIVDRQTAGDQAGTDDNIFRDDNRIQDYTIRLDHAGQSARVTSELYYRDSKYLARVFFHEEFPILEKTIRFVVPPWLQLEFKEMNFDGYLITKEEKKERENTIYSFTMKNVGAVVTEKNQMGFALTYPHLLIMVKSFDFGGSQQQGISQPSDLYKWYSQLYGLCKNDPTQLKERVDQLTKGKTTDLEKIKSIYYWVQDNIRYFAFEDGYAGFVPESAQKVLQDKFGDCKGMANLLTEMLKLVGFDAHFTWIGTRSLPYDHAQTAAICVDNHAICTLYYQGKTYFLDATESYIPFGENAYRIQGKSAMVEKGTDFSIEYVPVSEKNANTISTRASFTLDGKNLKGHVRMTMTGNERTSFLQFYQSLSTDKKPEFLHDFMQFGNGNLSVSTPVISNLEDREIPVTLESDIDLSNNITIAGKETFASIDFFPKSLSSFMPDAKRQRGYDFQSRFTYEDSIELSVPPDRVFTDLPETISDEHGDYSFHGSYQVKGHTILLKKTVSINNSQIKTVAFPDWISFLKKIKTFNNSQLTIVQQ